MLLPRQLTCERDRGNSICAHIRFCSSSPGAFAGYEEQPNVKGTKSSNVSIYSPRKPSFPCRAAGVNVADTLMRENRAPPLPSVLGLEAAGVIEGLGASVNGPTIGMRLAAP